MKWLTATFYLLAVQILHYYLWAHGTSSLVVNTHASWGVPLQNWLALALSVGIIITAFIIGARHKPAFPLLMLLIIASGLSNVFDRVWYGGVIDYIDIGFWPVFNIPDTVMTGVIWYYLYSMIKPRGSRHSEPGAR